MANRVWRGDAVAVAQVVRVTPGVVTIGQAYSVRINSKDVTVTAGSNSGSALVDLLVAAIAAAGIPEWSEITATNSGGVLVLTGRTKGEPFQVSTLAGGFTQGAAIVVTVAHTPSGGTWLFDAGDPDDPDNPGYGTVNIGFADSGATVQSAMDGLFGAGNTLVTKRTYTATTAVPAHVTYTIEFIAAFANEPVPAVTVTYASLTGGDALLTVETIQESVVGTSEVQTITFYGTTGGTFRFEFRGAFVDLAWNVSTATMQTNIRALLTINGPNVDVTGTAGVSYVCTFKAALAHQALDPIRIYTTNLTGTIFADVAVTTPGVAGVVDTQYIEQHSDASANEVFTITKSGTVSGGTFKLTYDTLSNQVVSVAIAYNKKLYEIIAILEALVATKQGVTYSGPYFAPTYEWTSNYTMADAGGTFYISCLGVAGGQNQGFDGSSGNLAAIGIDGALLTGGGSYTTPGAGGTDGTKAPSTTATTGGFKLRVGSSTHFTNEMTLSVDGAGVILAPTPEEVQAELEALPEYGVGNVRVSAVQIEDGDYSDITIGSRLLWKVEAIGALSGTTVPLLNNILTTAPSSGAHWTPLAYRLQGGTAGTTEVQTLTVHGAASHGSLTLGFAGFTTAPVLYNDPAVAVEGKLIALANVDPGDLTAAGGPLGSAGVPITFGGQYTYTDVPTITVDDTLLKVGVVRTTPGVTGQNEKQRLSMKRQDVWAGTFRLDYNGDTTGSLDFDATAADVQTELETAVGAANFRATLGPFPETDIEVEFIAALAEADAHLITVDTNALTNGTATAVSYDPLIVATAVRASGPNHWNDPTNWFNPAAPTESRVPERLDQVFLASGKIDILSGLVQRSTFTVDQVNDWIIPTERGHDLIEGQIVEVWSTATLPTGLTANTSYYIRDLDTATGKFKLAASINGAAINLTGAGSGTMQVGVRLAGLLQLATYTGKIGRPVLNKSGYFEYRELDLTIGVTAAGTITIGQGEGNGSALINLDTGSDEIVLEVLASAGAQNGASVNWKGSSPDTLVRVLAGDLGIALRPTETAACDLIELRGGELRLGTVAVGSLDKTGGQLSRIDSMTLSGTQMIRG